ncbi:DUF799 domain-containing protein [Neisseria montereyensis]|uniref:DUF799 domain-containing protein n=1 Tax=Neisseria montereyensis TaxID=2973938 RepID=A0ABT2FEN8_9NEIS|nr:DUF799 domain-containing protein [Neisseria montereyensis]MCS4534679.1 DUF799 domain-containing protein [Neisseria montereyensis]
MRSLKLLPLVAALALSACATQPYDYTAFKESDPKSILVLPPLNESPDVNATAGMASAVTLPLAESGYYVFPVAVVQETFKQNGLTNPADIHDVQLDKLNQIFGADAVLYIKVTEYGTKFMVIQSDTRVSAEAKLVDARTGKELWTGSATASTLERGSSQAGLLGALVQAVVEQIASSVSDRGYDIAQMTGSRLLSAGTPKGILYGPRSPHYHTQHNK